MIQYRIPVRQNMPQQFSYTFYDQNGNIIPLTNYLYCFLELKLQGAVYQTLSAGITSPASLGQVQYSSFAFPEVGIWDAQFYCEDGSGNLLYGEPIQLTVVPNVDTLALTQLPIY